MRLRHDEFVPHAPEHEGTVNIHHCKQGKGNDRLYITRTADAILAYCHHCGARGSYSIAYAKVKKHRAKSAGESSAASSWSIKQPRDYTQDTNCWPVAARLWIGRATINKEECKRYGIGWSESLGRVLISLYNKDGTYIGWQGRNVCNDERPKYITRILKHNEPVFHIKHDQPYLVLVEDILSCIKVGRSHNCCALLGTTISTYIQHICSEYKHIYLWLDNDNPDIKMKQCKLLTQLQLLTDVSLVKTNVDPKYISTEEINHVLSSR